jgi:PEP-CTERM motif
VTTSGTGYATAEATGGTGDTHAGVATANASVTGASSGDAIAYSSTSMTGGSVGASAYAPVGGDASASTVASIGSGTPELIPISAGEAISDATLTPGASTIAVGGMSIGYGGSGEPLEYETAAGLSFTTTSPETLYLTLVSNTSTGDGFDTLVFDIDSSVGDYAYTFTTLAAAEAFFTANPLDLGNAGTGSQYVDIYEYLYASESDPPGFSYDYALAETPYVKVIPEPSTWAMMLIGFAGLGFLGYRKTAKARAAA